MGRFFVDRPVIGASFIVLISVIAPAAFLVIFEYLKVRYGIYPVDVLYRSAMAISHLGLYLCMMGVAVFGGGYLSARLYGPGRNSVRLIWSCIGLGLVASFFLYRLGVHRLFNIFSANIFLWILFVLAAAIVWQSLRHDGRVGAYMASQADPREGDVSKLKWVLGGLVLLTFFNVSPDVIRFWDSSGWMDSQGYDMAAHRISTGQDIAGNGYYMPVYQFGMALLYFIFGHVFAVQQVVNILMAISSVILMSLAAWNIYRNIYCMAIVGATLAFLDQFHHAVYYTQIENWYIPIFSLAIYAVTVYWRNPSVRRLVFVGVAAGIVLNCRTQGSFFVAMLCATPFFTGRLPFLTRVRHALLIGVIVLATLVPWSIRNYVVENRLSPSSSQGATQLAILNDPRIGLYGVRYDIGYAEIEKEWLERYPDANERLAAQKAYFVSRLLHEPQWFLKAAGWRALAFYGLIPPGAWAPEGPQPTDWPAAWRGYLGSSFVYLVLIIGSIISLASRRPNAPAAYLALTILANLSVAFLVGSGEPRICYPVLPLHLLLLLQTVWKPITGPDPSPREMVSAPQEGQRRRWLYAAVAAALVVTALWGVRSSVGRGLAYRPVIEPTLRISPEVRLDGDLPDLSKYLAALQATSPHTAPQIGKRFRVRLLVQNYMFPPKFNSPVPYIYPPASDPRRETFFYSDPIGPTIYPGFRLAVTYFGAVTDAIPREGQMVDAEVEIKGLTVPPWFKTMTFVWIEVEKMKLVTGDAAR